MNNPYLKDVWHDLKCALFCSDNPDIFFLKVRVEGKVEIVEGYVNFE